MLVGLKKQTAKPPARAGASCTRCSPRTKQRTGSTGLGDALTPEVSSERLFPFHGGVGLRVVQECSALAPGGPMPRSALFDPLQSCQNVIHWQEQQGAGSSSLLTSSPLTSTMKALEPHHTPSSPGVTAQPPTGKNKSAPAVIESERTDRIIKAGIGVILFPFLGGNTT